MMTARTRLKVSAVMVLLSVIYGWVLLTQSDELASALAIGYIAIMLTAIALTNLWKKP